MRNAFHKAIAATDWNSSDGSRQSIKWKASWKGLLILDAVENIRDSWEEAKTSPRAGVRKKLIPALVGDFEGFKASMEEVTADGVETTRELELEAEPEVVTELLRSRDQS